jgi:hypothetical protein
MPAPIRPPVRQLRTAILSLALLGLSLTAPAPAAEPPATAPATRPAVAADTTLLNLRVPGSHAARFGEVWQRALRAQGEGRALEAHAAFRELVGLLDEIESRSRAPLAVIEAKAVLQAEQLGNRSAARREIDRALALAPDSARSLALKRKLDAEEAPRKAPTPVTPQPGD